MPKKKKLKPKKISWRTKLLFLAGLVLILIPGIFYLNQSLQLMFFVPEVKTTTIKTYASPIAIDIPSVRIKLPIAQTQIVNNVWGISNNGISHLAVSANPGEIGPIILYGHNTNDRFGPIRWLSKGSVITLTTSDKKKHSYTIVETQTVAPSELSIFFSRQEETLYLYTCDGFADLKRFVVIAEPT